VRRQVRNPRLVLRRPNHSLLKNIIPIDIRYPTERYKYPELNDYERDMIEVAYTNFVGYLDTLLTFLVLGTNIDRSSEEWKHYVYELKSYLGFVEYHLMELRTYVGRDICYVSYEAFKNYVYEFFEKPIPISEIRSIVTQMKREVSELVDIYDIYVL